MKAHKTSFYGHGLDTLQTAIMDQIRTLPWIEPRTPPAAKPPDAAVTTLNVTVEGMLRRFDRFVRQLNRRHDERAGLPVNDEYDMQDLLHSLLRTVADDVRAEEVSPSHAGASSRMDFLLKDAEIVVEAKLASATLRDKQVGEQLVVDISRYSTHPNCTSLYCLVYDPGNHIKNPRGLESDLTGRDGNVNVIVFLVPQ